jgi:hypothetical protein
VSVSEPVEDLLAISVSSRESLTCSSSERQPDIRLPACVVDNLLVKTVTLFAMISKVLYSAGSPVLEISRAFDQIQPTVRYFPPNQRLYKGLAYLLNDCGKVAFRP